MASCLLCPPRFLPLLLLLSLVAGYCVPVVLRAPVVGLDAGGAHLVVANALHLDVLWRKQEREQEVERLPNGVQGHLVEVYDVDFCVALFPVVRIRIVIQQLFDTALHARHRSARPAARQRPLAALAALASPTLGRLLATRVDGLAGERIDFYSEIYVFASSVPAFLSARIQQVLLRLSSLSGATSAQALPVCGVGTAIVVYCVLALVQRSSCIVTAFCHRVIRRQATGVVVSRTLQSCRFVDAFSSVLPEIFRASDERHVRLV